MRVELLVKYFDHDDLPHLNDWLRARNHKALEMVDLPSIGFVVMEEEERVAVCFLRQAEGNVGIIDGLCTNPEAHSEIRNAAIDLAVRMVCEAAKQFNIPRLIAWCQDAGTLTRAFNRHGFVQQPDTLMAKDLTEAQNTH